VNDDIYYFIATSFLRPHLEFKQYLSMKKQDQALSTKALDMYIKDTVISFFRFFLFLGPVIYRTYILPK